MSESKNGKIDIDRYRVKEGEKISLKDFPTACDVKIEKAEVKERYFPETIEKLRALQEKLYAQNSGNPVIANNLSSLLSNYRKAPEDLQRASVIARRLKGSDFPPYQDTYG